MTSIIESSLNLFESSSLVFYDMGEKKRLPRYVIDKFL